MGGVERAREVQDKLTVFIPTYNRAYVLPRAYESLLAQTCQEFCVVIVDDGSTDDTRELVDTWRAEGALDITYAYQPNGGKARAHNLGVELCATGLFVVLDSDDQLVPTAVEEIYRCWGRVGGRDDAAGIVALCGEAPDRPLRGEWFPPDLTETTLWNLRYKIRHRSDVVLVYRTELLREYPFVVPDGEKFMAEPFVYHQIDQVAPLVVLNKVLSVVEYLGDGYTANVRKVTRENPRSYMLLKRGYVDYSDTFVDKWKNATLYLVGAHFAGAMGEGLRDLHDPILAAAAFLPSQVLVHTVYREKAPHVGSGTRSKDGD